MLQSIQSLIKNKMESLRQVTAGGPCLSSSVLYQRDQMLRITETRLIQGYQSMTRGCACPSAPAASVAPSEQGRIWGDPHFEGGDGDRFDVQGEAGKSYHLLSDTGLMLNGSFVDFSPGKTVVGETGLTLSGPAGSSKIVVSARPERQVTLNGVPLQAGQVAPTADGGELRLSADGQTVRVKTREGYQIEQDIKIPGPRGELEIRVTTPDRGVASEGRLPGGLLGQTFDADKAARNSQSSNGEGAIAGSVGDYEVPGGVFGEPQPGVMTAPQNLAGLDALLLDYQLGSASQVKFPSVNPLTCQKVNWAEEIRQDTLDSLQKNCAKQAKKQVLSNNAETNRLAHLLQLALCSGNINLAMMLFSHIESRSSNEVTRGLMNKVQGMQEKKRQLAQEIQNQKDDADGSKNIQKIKVDIDQASDDINVLQTFIRDVAQNKQQSVELANAFISKEHETTMSVLRTWSR